MADLLDWRRGAIGWSDFSHSLLLYGPPGTGKTWLARAMGNSAGIAHVSASFAEWQAAGHLGDMLREMRRSFAMARRAAPANFFIDEIDAVGARGGEDWHNQDYRTQVINAFLGELNALATKPKVKSQKNDMADAEAIAQAGSRPTMRFVEVKTPEQQGLGMIFRLRDLLVGQRTQVINALRGHLSEFGLAAGTGRENVDKLRGVPEPVTEEADDLPAVVRHMAQLCFDQIDGLSPRSPTLMRRSRRPAGARGFQPG